MIVVDTNLVSYLLFASPVMEQAEASVGWGKRSAPQHRCQQNCWGSVPSPQPTRAAPPTIAISWLWQVGWFTRQKVQMKAQMKAEEGQGAGRPPLQKNNTFPPGNKKPDVFAD
ncbi:MAG: hypothetical protein ACYCTW_03285 [Sulfuricella sp.]